MDVALDLPRLSFVLLAAVAAGGLVFAVLIPFVGKPVPAARLRALSEPRRSGLPSRQSALNRFTEGQKDNRRKQVQETLRQLDERTRMRQRRVTLRKLLLQAGLSMPVRVFWLASAFVGLLTTLPLLVAGLPWYLAGFAAIVGFLGLPRWYLYFLRRRRLERFTDEFADAVDVMVRSLKAGLPLIDAMKVIAAESGPPVGPEFIEVVEGQRIGITLDQGLERMFDRVPVPEVNFLAIVLSIQSKSGGNLAEALSNLSKVLRDRKRMKAKIQSVSQESKSSAAIIGSLPLVIMSLMAVVNPSFLSPLFSTDQGRVILIGGGLWMLLGVAVMRKMIDFRI